MECVFSIHGLSPNNIQTLKRQAKFAVPKVLASSVLAFPFLSFVVFFFCSFLFLLLLSCDGKLWPYQIR